MIKIKNKDSIIDIIKKIENCENKEIILEFPIGNSILHNYTALKILKNKASKKNLIIITNDLSAKNIGKKLGIKYSLLKDKKLIKNIDLLEYNYSFGEYFLFLIKSYFIEIKNFFINQKHLNSKKYKFLKYKNNEKSRIGFFFTGLLISFFILFFIFYFAVNKTYIKIIPETIIKKRAKNFVFQELQQNQITENKDIIKLKKISKLVYLKENFSTFGIKESENTKSKGSVVLINNLNEKIPLLQNTRLETKDGITFLIKNRITIPAGKKDKNGKIKPGKINVKITARHSDNKGKFIGNRGNIGSGTTLYFPGLKDLGNSVYAKTIGDFYGGNNNYTKTVGKDDVKNAKALLEEKLKNYSLKELKKQIKQENETNNITYEILGINKIINYSQLKITGDENIKIGEERKNFELSGTIKITTYIFNKDLLINKLKKIIREGLIENIENINFIDKKSLRISNLIYKKEKPFEVKATTEIEVSYSHNFLSKTNNYIQKLKNTISGIKKEEAQKILINNPKISDVKIETRPFFMNKVSNIEKNIIFEVEE